MPEYAQDPTEKWAIAQGRALSISSPRHLRGSVSSQAGKAAALEQDLLSKHRETILDRAFQMQFIPGSDRELPGEEKLGSLARFDALMRQVDEKRKQREFAEDVELLARRTAPQVESTSDEVHRYSHASEETELGNDESDYEYTHEQDPHVNSPSIDATARRALDFIAERRDTTNHLEMDPRAHKLTTPLGVRTEARSSILQSTPLRPHTAHARSRPATGKRAQSTCYTPMSNASEPSTRPSGDVTQRSNAEKRLSTSSNKRLSFTEFTKRLSSTSSLLLVQTHAGTGSGEGDAQSVTTRSSLKPCTGLLQHGRIDNESKCGWHSVIEAQGGFL